MIKPPKDLFADYNTLQKKNLPADTWEKNFKRQSAIKNFDGNGSSNTLAAVWNWSTSGTKANTTKLMLNVNMDYYAGITEDNLDGESSKSGAGLLDRTLAHEFTHAMMATNIHYFNWLPKFIKEGMAELTHGIDDFRPTKIFQNAYDADWLDASLSLTDTGTGNQNIGDGYSGGYMFLRYLAKQAALQSVADDLQSSTNPLLITLTENADTYNNSLAGATIQALAGNDFIYNYAASVSIDGGLGNDTVWNYGDNVTIDGGEGNDYLYTGGTWGNPWNYNGNNVSINGGSGNDSIFNTGSNITINGGTGNDTINNSYVSYKGLFPDSLGIGKNVIFEYKNGDGNDLIQGFKTNSTLKIGNGTTDTFTSVKSGNDFIIKVGDGNITLNGAASLSTVHVAGTYMGPGGKWAIRDGYAEYTDENGEVLITVYNISSNAKLSDFIGPVNNIVTINANALSTDDENNTFLEGEGYSLKFASDVVTVPSSVGGHWGSLVGGKATYTTTYKSAYYKLEENTTAIYNKEQGGEELTLSGIKSTLTSAVVVDEENSTVTLKNAALGTDKVTLDGETYSLALDASVVQAPVKGGAKFTAFTNGTATYKIFGDSAYYTLDGNEVYYTKAADDNISTISGLATNLTLSNGAINGITVTKINADNVKFTLSAKALKNTKVTVSGTGATLALADDVDTIAEDLTGWTTLTSGNVAYLTGGKGSYYSLAADSKSVTYKASVEGSNKVELSGAQSLTNNNVNGTTVNLTNNNFKSNVGVVSNAGNYQFSLSGALSGKKFMGSSIAADTITNSGTNLFIDGGAGADRVTNSGSSVSIDGGADNDYVYNSAASVTIDVGDGADTVYNSYGHKAKISLGAGNDSLYNYYGHSISVDAGVGNDSIYNYYGSYVSINGGAGNDTVINSGSYVTITGGAGNDVFTYSKGSFKITDYTASADKISLDIAKIEDVVLSNKDVVLSMGQGSSITIANGKDKKITFASKKTAQYIFGDHAIFNSGKTAATLLATIPSFNANSYSNFVTVDATKTTKPINIIGNDKANVIKAGANNSTLNGGKGNDTLYGGNGVDIFVYEKNTGNDVIQSYTSGKDKISLGAGASISGFSVTKAGDGLLKINGSNNLTIKKATGDDIANNGKVITIIDSIGKETTNTYFNPNNAVNGNKATLLPEYEGTFTATSNITNVNATQNENPLVLKGNSKNNILTSGTGADTLSGDAGNDKLLGGEGNDSLSGGDGADTLSGGAGNDKLLGGAGNDSLSAGDGADTLSGDAGNDKLLGGAGNDSLSGGDGADTLSGGAGNDTLTGDKGKDLFVFNGGKDVITDYASEDKISVDKNLGAGIYKVSGKNIVLTYGSNSLTINNGLDKKITFDDGTSGTYTKAGIFNSDKTAVTLPAATKSFKATSSSYSKLVTVDASAATSTINITGNKLANYFIAGNNGSTLDGSTGNDTLKGGKGKDSLIGGAGHDSLYGGAGADILRGGAGNDTLWGGAGNDSLYGDAGNDTFIFRAGEGNDYIFNYSSGDMLQILNAKDKAGSFTKSMFSGGTLSLTISGGGSVVFNGVAKGDTFNINNKTYKISGKILK